MSARQLVASNKMVDWQVAPADHEIVNYDEHKWRYRQEVESFIKSIPLKSLKRKTFITISTNVLCADLQTKGESIDPIDKDIYLPLEIALTKWSMSEAKKSSSKRSFDIKIWLIDPGRPTTSSVNYARDHQKLHKIDCVPESGNYVHFERDYEKIAKEINAMLTPDRTVFSVQLRNCRQDLGCLKWLNRQNNYKIKPIKVFSIEDLYVVSIRTMIDEHLRKNICQGLARYRLEFVNAYEDNILCQYHRDILKQDEEAHSPHCARALSVSCTNTLLDDVGEYTDLFSQEDASVNDLEKTAVGY